MEYRHYCLARHFKRMGHRPVIVGASFHHLMTEPPKRARDEIDGIPYEWIKTCRYRGNHLGRVMNMLQYSWRLTSKRLRHVPAPDVVIASSPHPFVAASGARIAKKHQAKFIFEVRDLWPLTLLEIGGHSPRHPLVRAMAWAERTGYERCDYTVSLMEGAKDYMVAHGLDADKFVCIPNGFDTQSPEDKSEPLPDEHRQTLENLKEQGKRIVLYSGHHGPANALDNLIDAARLLEDDQPIHLLLVGQGPEKQRLQTQAQQAPLSNLTFLPPVARAQMPAVMNAVDIGYVGLQKKNLFQYGISPNKLFEYMAAGLPVIFAIETRYDEVAQAQCGFSIAAEDPVALAALLRRIGQIPKQQLDEMGARGQDHVRCAHTYDHLAERYAHLF